MPGVILLLASCLMLPSFWLGLRFCTRTTQGDVYAGPSAAEDRAPRLRFAKHIPPVFSSDRIHVSRFFVFLQGMTSIPVVPPRIRSAKRFSGERSRGPSGSCRRPSCGCRTPRACRPLCTGSVRGMCWRGQNWEADRSAFYLHFGCSFWLWGRGS